MFELKYDILDDLDAKTVNVQELSDNGETDSHTISVSDFYQKVTDTECSHILVVGIQIAEDVQIEQIKERINQIVHRFFPDVPDAHVTFPTNSVSSVCTIISAMTFNDFTDYDNYGGYLEYTKLKNTVSSALIKIPIKLPFYTNAHIVNKMLNFMASLRGAYVFNRTAKISRMLVYSLYEDGPYKVPEKLDIGGFIYNIKFNKTFHLNDTTDVYLIVEGMCLLFNDGECITKAVQDWFAKYSSVPLFGGPYTYEKLKTAYENYKELNDRITKDAFDNWLHHT